ncbi:MAG: hypothetical protein BMS9Abin25_1571 [Gammaproteobacteria bacterium]|nr:MAG: hypothetical protein BMS9Abin25_1571 [Gammaproteobacteria bacterium]
MTSLILKSRVVKTIFVLFVLSAFALPVQAAKECKGSSKSACTSSSSCTWVSGYSRADGEKVKSYCRAAAGKGSSSSASGTKKKDNSASSAKKEKKVSSKKKDKKDKTKEKDKKKDKKNKKDKKDKKGKKDKK